MLSYRVVQLIDAISHVIRDLSWFGVAAGLALALGWVGSSFLVVRPVKTLVRATALLATGDLSTRTGLRHGTSMRRLDRSRPRSVSWWRGTIRPRL